MSYHEAVEAANALAHLLETLKPRRGLKRAKHVKTLKPARAKVAKALRSYFNRQREALLREVKPKIPALLAMRTEASTPGGRRFADTLLPTSLHPLRFPVSNAEDDEYAGAVRDAIAGAAATLAGELKSGKSISDDVASRYLRDNSLTKLTGDFSDTSVQRLRDAVADAWDEGGSFNQVVRAIETTFDDFTTTRSELIAQTEMADAYNEGRDAIAREAGLDEKSWETESGDPCPICIDNEDAGWIDIDDDFPSGDDAPTAHPNCLCILNFRKTSE